MSSVAGDQLKINHLVENIDSIEGWRGPYVNYKIDTERLLLYKDYVGLHVLKTQKHDVSGLRVNCVVSLPCYTWVHITGIPKKFTEEIDKKIDGSFDFAAGRLQGSDYSVYKAGTNSISFKVMPSLSMP